MKITVNSNCLTMGNCCDRCFGRANKRKYLRTRYNVERDISIEFENLMDDEPHQEELAKVVLPHERSLLLGHRYEDLVSVQKTLDAEIDSQLVRQEEELRMEEEAYYEAKREASRVARMQRQKELAARNKAAVGGASAWVADDDEWELAAGDDNFEKFLDSVNARSLEARTRALPQQVPIDAQSSGSSTHTKDDRSRTEASSIDLEWEHEAGMQPPPPKEKRRRHKNRDTENGVIEELAVWPSMLSDANDKQDAFSNEFEWDSDFESNSSQNESRTLLKRGKNEETANDDAGTAGVS